MWPILTAFSVELDRMVELLCSTFNRGTTLGSCEKVWRFPCLPLLIESSFFWKIESVGTDSEGVHY